MRLDFLSRWSRFLSRRRVLQSIFPLDELCYYEAQGGCSRSGVLRYLFEDCAIDTDRRELRRGLVAVAVPIEPQVFDLLVYLIRNRERVVSKDDLLASVWHGRLVSESTLNTRISSARFAIGDNGEDQRLIKTLPRRGIRFVGAVREQTEGAAEGKRDDRAANETPPSRSDLSRAAVPPAARPVGWRGTAIDIGAWLRTLQLFQAHKGTLNNTAFPHPGRQLSFRSS